MLKEYQKRYIHASKRFFSLPLAKREVQSKLYVHHQTHKTEQSGKWQNAEINDNKIQGNSSLCVRWDCKKMRNTLHNVQLSWLPKAVFVGMWQINQG